MSTLSISTISINLAAKQMASANPSIHLVPSLDGTRYYTSGLWRGILVMIYKIAEKVFKSDLLKINSESIEEAMKSSFSKKMKSVQFAHRTYKQHLDFLKRIPQALEPKKESLFKAIEKITAWNQWIFPRLEKNMGKEYEEFVEINDIQKLILLESLIKTPMPLQSLLKLANEQDIKEEDKNDLNPWIEEINTKLNSRYLSEHYLISCSVLHSALNKLVDDDQIARDNIENGLSQLGCAIFSTEDKTQKKFREEIYKNRVVMVDGKPIKLGEPLSAPKFNENDQFHVYPFLEDPQKVIVIPINPALINRQENDYQESESIIAFVEPLQVDYMGRFKICPKLIPLKDCWPSLKEYHKKKVILQIATFVKKALKRKQTPKNLELKRIFLDKNFLIVSSIPYFQGEFDYYCLENFIFEATEKSPGSFIDIMLYLENYLPKSYRKNEDGKGDYRKEENIFQHTLFYQNLVEETLKGIQLNRENISKKVDEKINGFESKEVKIQVENGMKVVNLVKDQQNSILEQVRQLHIDHQQALKDIARIYLEEYQKGKYGAILPDRLVSTVIERYQDEVVSHGRFYNFLVEKIVHKRSIINDEVVSQLVNLTTNGLKEEEIKFLVEKGKKLPELIEKQQKEILIAVLPEFFEKWWEKRAVKNIEDIYFEEYLKGKYFGEITEKLIDITTERFRKEAIPLALDQHVWSTCGNKFSEKDRIFGLALLNWIKMLIENHKLPENLSQQSVYFNDRNKIFCDNKWSKTYDYCKIENFLFNFTEKYPYMFHSIMNQLKKDIKDEDWPERDFYRSVVKNFLLQCDYSKGIITSIASKMSLKLTKTLFNNATKLAQQVIDQRNSILKSLKNGNLGKSVNEDEENEEYNDVEEKITEMIIQVYGEEYDKIGFISVLPQLLVDIVIKRCQTAIERCQKKLQQQI